MVAGTLRVPSGNQRHTECACYHEGRRTASRIASAPRPRRARACPLLLPLLPTLRTDALGDPLPAGAVARLGSARWCVDGRAPVLRYAADGETLLIYADSRRGFEGRVV